ncbi:hypothetical protein ABPG75_005978 [Micractinium tetrahymenae]
MHVAWRATTILATSPSFQAAVRAYDGPNGTRLQEVWKEFTVVAGMAAEAAAMGLLCLLRLTNPGDHVAGGDSPDLRQAAVLLRRTAAKPASIVQALDQLSEVLASTRAVDKDDCKEQDGFVMLVDMLAVLLQTDARSEGHCCEERVLLAERPQLLDRLAGMLDDSVRHQLARPACVSAARLIWVQLLVLTHPLLLERYIYPLLGLRGGQAALQLIGQRLAELEGEQAAQPAAGGSGTGAAVAAGAAAGGVAALQRVLLAGAVAGLAEATAAGVDLAAKDRVGTAMAHLLWHTNPAGRAAPQDTGLRIPAEDQQVLKRSLLLGIFKELPRLAAAAPAAAAAAAALARLQASAPQLAPCEQDGSDFSEQRHLSELSQGDVECAANALKDIAGFAVRATREAPALGVTASALFGGVAGAWLALLRGQLAQQVQQSKVEQQQAEHTGGSEGSSPRGALQSSQDSMFFRLQTLLSDLTLQLNREARAASDLPELQQQEAAATRLEAALKDSYTVQQAATAACLLSAGHLAGHPMAGGPRTCLAIAAAALESCQLRLTRLQAHGAAAGLEGNISANSSGMAAAVLEVSHAAAALLPQQQQPPPSQAGTRGAEDGSAMSSLPGSAAARVLWEGWQCVGDVLGPASSAQKEELILQLAAGGALAAAVQGLANAKPHLEPRAYHQLNATVASTLGAATRLLAEREGCAGDAGELPHPGTAEELQEQAAQLLPRLEEAAAAGAQERAVQRCMALSQRKCAHLGCTNAALLAGPLPGVPADEAPRPRRCGGCRRVRYCSEECCRADWRAHRRACRALAAQAEAAGQGGEA